MFLIFIKVRNIFYYITIKFKEPFGINWPNDSLGLAKTAFEYSPK